MYSSHLFWRVPISLIDMPTKILKKSRKKKTMVIPSCPQKTKEIINLQDKDKIKLKAKKLEDTETERIFVWLLEKT